MFGVAGGASAAAAAAVAVATSAVFSLCSSPTVTILVLSPDCLSLASQTSLLALQVDTCLCVFVCVFLSALTVFLPVAKTNTANVDRRVVEVVEQ